MLRDLIAIAIALVVVWLAVVIAVIVRRPDGTTVRDAARLLPDTLRLVRRLAADRALPRRTRWLVWLLLAYLVSPIDIIPDFIPVVGYADDVVITSWVLRRVIRAASDDKLAEHWPGSPDALATLRRLLRLPAAR
jgi:uncharacterized membrane protein YkvA (DUF1232 family)